MTVRDLANMMNAGSYVTRSASGSKLGYSRANAVVRLVEMGAVALLQQWQMTNLVISPKALQSLWYL